MRAVRIVEPGPEAGLVVEEVPDPVRGPEDLELRVVASGVNRADLLQRRGLYPPPPGVTDVPGLECAGEVLWVGEGVRNWKIGDRAMALLAGGGYAERVVCHAGSAMLVPPGLDLVAAAGVPEVFLTVFLTVFQLARLAPGELLLVHGGGGGIGTAAIQLARVAGARVLVTAGRDETCERCRALGADGAVNHRTGSFPEAARELSGGMGVDVVLDPIGAPYLADHLATLATGGRLVSIGLMGGARAELDLAKVLTKRLSILGSTLRARPVAKKVELVRAFVERFGPDLASGRLAPVIDRVLPVTEAREAHAVLERREHFGKVVLTW